MRASLQWMAPEQLDEQLYSFASDTWSFGVILFEIFNSSMPWPKISNMKAAQLVLNEHHLAEPKYLPSRAPRCVEVVMLAAFEYEPKNRPKMSWVVKKLSKDYGKADGGEMWTKGTHRTLSAPPAAAGGGGGGGEGLYAAPPSGLKKKKNLGDATPAQDNYAEPPSDDLDDEETAAALANYDDAPTSSMAAPGGGRVVESPGADVCELCASRFCRRRLSMLVGLVDCRRLQ